MTKEAGFTQNIVKDTKIVSSVKIAQNSSEVKTAPSLFDSMLEGAKQTEKSTVSTSSTTTKQSLPKENNTDTQVSKKEIVDVKDNKNSSTATITTNAIDKSSQDSVDSASSPTTKSVSLLDKLIQEATKSVKEEESLKIEDKQSENSSKNIALQQGKKTSQTSETLDTKTKSSSLLDKLLEEANTSIKNQSTSNNKAQLENENKITTPIVKENNEVTQNKDAALNIATTLTLEKETEKTDKINLNSSEQKNTKEAASQPSLLDKLIKDATQTLEVKDTKNTEEVQNIKVVQTKEVKTLEQNSLNTKELDVSKITTIIENKTSATQTQTQTISNETTTTQKTVNEKVANELAKITENSVEKTPINKEQISNLKDKNEPLAAQKEVNNSLMDRLLQENKVAKNIEENGQNQKATSINSGKTQTNEVLNNIYLSSLNKAAQDGFLQKTQEVKTLVANATSTKEIQKGADLLNLNLQKSEVILEEEQFKQNVKNDFLNKLSVNREIVKHDITKMSEAIIEQSKSIKSEATATVANNLLTSKNLPEVEVSVSSSTAYNIENKIVGARQHMNTMMSDMAKSMYLNYKPPVTAFRMNLNPGNLGSIAVLIKNDKTNGLSISLNMSNVATMDSFVDNQAALRAALAKNFDTTSNINLEFNMQDGQQQNKQQQQNSKQHQNHQATNDILESLNNKGEITEKVTNYM